LELAGLDGKEGRLTYCSLSEFIFGNRPLNCCYIYIVKKIFLLITFIPLLSIAQSNKKQVDDAYGYSDNIIARYPTAGDTVLFEKIVPLQGLTRSQIVERTSKIYT
jgi:hypothetical protein